MFQQNIKSPNFLAELYFSVALNHLKQRNYLEHYLIQLTKKLSEVRNVCSDK